MTKARVIGLGFGIILILAAFGIVLWQTVNMPTTSTAFAQGAATATPGATATAVPQQTQPQPQQAQIGDTFWANLASKLGVSADDLKAKAVETRQEMIDQAVKDGRITQAQADAIKQRITANNIIAPIQLPRGANQVPNNNPPNNNQPPHRMPFPPFGNRAPGFGFGNRFPGGVFGYGMLGGGLEQLNAVAKVLKLEPKALIEQLSQGKSLAEIAKAQGVDEASVKQAIIDYRTAQIDQLLSLGLISEVQANQMKARLTPDSIDLSRGFRFQFQTTPGQSKSSEVFPDFEMGQAFGDAPGVFNFDGQMTVPFGDVQTQ